jgi:hypothetical protein
LTDRGAGCAIDSSEPVNELGNQNVRRATHSRVPVPRDPQGSQGQVRRRVSQADGCGHTLEWRLRTRKADEQCLRCESNRWLEDLEVDFGLNEETTWRTGSTNAALQLSGVFEVPGEPHERNSRVQ